MDESTNPERHVAEMSTFVAHMYILFQTAPSSMYQQNPDL